MPSLASHNVDTDLEIGKYMILARGPQTKFLYDLCCAILGVPHTYVALGRHFGMRLCIGMGLGTLTYVFWLSYSDDEQSWNRGLR